MPDISIGRLRGGYCVSWTDATTGKRRRYQLEARSRSQAEPEAIDVYRRATVKPTGHTVSDLWQMYVEHLTGRATGRNMRYLGPRIMLTFGAYRPDQVTTAMCRDYDASRRAEGMKQNTVWTELGYLRSTLKYAEDERLIGRAPKIWRPTKPDVEMRILNLAQARALIEAANAPHIRLALVMLLGTAGRISAVLDLTWDRVDFDRGTINLRLDNAETRKGRAVVPMNPATRAALSAAREAALSDHVIEYGGDRIASIKTGFAAAVKRSGIGKVTIHELRHTAAVTMLGAGVPIEKVGQVLGHSNLATTYRIYGRFMPEQMQDAVNILNFTGLQSRGGKVR